MCSVDWPVDINRFCFQISLTSNFSSAEMQGCSLLATQLTVHLLIR